VFSRFTKDGDKQVARAIDHRRAVGKAIDAVDEAVDGHDARHAVERADGGADVGERVERADGGRLLCRGDRLLPAHLSGVRELAVAQAQRPGAKKQIAGAHGGDVAAGGSRWRGQLVAEGGEAFFGSHAEGERARVPCKGNAPICARGMDSPLTDAGGVLCSITA